MGGREVRGRVPAESPAVVVAGAGPAGLTAAISAARCGAAVTVCEQLDRPGRKLLATGGGRCNLTNRTPSAEFMRRLGRKGRFAQPALAQMDAARLCRFLAELGVPTRAADGFHVFPCSNRAADVLDALLAECAHLGVRIVTGVRLTRLAIDGGEIHGILSTKNSFQARSVIVATGGKSYPSLGGTGGGYRLARKAGHILVEPVPGLAPLEVAETWPGSCAGAALPRVRAWIDLPRLRGEAAEGELLFTHTGLSGAVALDLSGAVSRLLLSRETVPLCLDFAPGIPRAEWIERFARWKLNARRKKALNFMDKYLPRSLARALCAELGGIGDLTPDRLKPAVRESLLRLLTRAPLTVLKTAGFRKAMVTCGGVSLKEVDPHSLESRLVKGLFFAGEILDLDGPCGGFNLQWAFSSGWLAGVTGAGRCGP
jgi:predicted Rossmann fold flavoprotein